MGMKLNRWAAVVAMSLALPLLPAVAGAQDSGPVHADHTDKNLRVTAPRETTRGSVVLTGHTFAQATVQVSGGVIPVVTFAGHDGAFTTEVFLRPNTYNKLVVTASTVDRRATVRVTVRQRLDRPAGTL